ncbi:lipoyl(octanoyl) transferase LipB [Akkermansiaceae bacterium]|jgi:lipoyl(octanoyl) transferase|nr:lipoyl(octanoyl) transferase LipB [Akkermansiaceae bacterium]
MSPLKFQDLGAGLDFQKTWDLQEDLVQRRRDQEIDDTILLLEHAPVYTIGRTRDKTSLEVNQHLPHPVVEINRGGQGTYHGPGQLVGYAILDLTNRKKDLHLHLRNLEEAIIMSLCNLGVTANRRDGLTGVWVGDRKIASLGVGVRSWVTLHGFALNVQAISLPPFQMITPCGIAGVSMTSIENEIHRPISMEEIKCEMQSTLRKIFS